MIRGFVNSRLDAVVRLRVRGPGGREVNVDAIIDTGFTSSLILPAATVTALGLIRQSGGSATLADGSVRQFHIYAGKSTGLAAGARCWCQRWAMNTSLACAF
jgi:predicted aspartyl protease